MPKFIDLTGDVYARLTVIGLHPEKTAAGRHQWRCRCECGKRIVALSNNLRRGNTQSCGCLQKEAIAEIAVRTNTTHGHASKGRTPEYQSYRSMIERCSNEAAINYENYGGRGIAVCKRWLGENGFANFLADLGPRPAGTSLERKRVNGNYTPTNTRWATCKEQANNRRDNVRVTYHGVTRSLMGWSDATGISYFTLQSRYRNGDRGAKLLRGVAA